MQQQKPFSIFLLSFLSIWFFKKQHCCCYANVFSLKMHHRFSDPVKDVLNKVSVPAKGSVEFYTELAENDKMFRGRGVSDSGDERLTFSDGNSSLRIKSLG